MERKIIGVTVGTPLNPQRIIEDIPNGGGSFASSIGYDNSTSGLEAENVQEAVDRLSSEIAYHKHSWNDLTDKPFGETDGVEITWDGNTEGITEIVAVGNMTFYLVSETDVPNDVLKNGTTTITHTPSGNTTVFENASSWTAYENGGFINDDIAALVETIVVVHTDNTTITTPIGDCTFAKKGVYFGEYVDDDSRTITTKLVCSGEVKQLDEKYIPDTIATKEYVDQLFGTNLAEVASLVGGDA